MDTTTAPEQEATRRGQLRMGVAGMLVALLLASCSSGGNTPTGAGGTSEAGGGSQPQQVRKIKVAHAFISAETLPIWVALDQKIFEKYGLQVEAVPLGEDMGGNIDGPAPPRDPDLLAAQVLHALNLGLRHQEVAHVVAVPGHEHVVATRQVELQLAGAGRQRDLHVA